MNTEVLFSLCLPLFFLTLFSGLEVIHQLFIGGVSKHLSLRAGMNKVVGVLC